MKSDFSTKRAVENELYHYSVPEQVYSIDTITLLQEAEGTRPHLTPRIVKFLEDANTFQEDMLRRILIHREVRKEVSNRLIARYMNGAVPREIVAAGILHLEDTLRPIEVKYEMLMKLYEDGIRQVEHALVPDRTEFKEDKRILWEAEKESRRNPF